MLVSMSSIWILLLWTSSQWCQPGELCRNTIALIKFRTQYGEDHAVGLFYCYNRWELRWIMCMDAANLVHSDDWDMLVLNACRNCNTNTPLLVLKCMVKFIIWYINIGVHGLCLNWMFEFLGVLCVVYSLF